MNPIDTKSISLDEFLDLLFNKSETEYYPNTHFPTEQHLNDFISNIDKYSDKQIKTILRKFIIHNCTFGADLIYRKVNNDRKQDNLAKEYTDTEYYRRLMDKKNNVWEGLTWVLDLLPHFPNEAIKGIDAYFLANCQFLPDDKLIALGDCTSIIRAKYINLIPAREQILNLNPLEFEVLVGKLYSEIGYKIEFTKKSHDGGIDIFAFMDKVAHKEKLILQCKRYKNNIGVKDIRELLGVVSDTKSNKGVLVTTSYFTRESIKLANKNPRIELIDYATLAKLFNEYLGSTWINRLDKLITDFKLDNKVSA
jgi:restriction system protein